MLLSLDFSVVVHSAQAVAHAGTIDRGAASRPAQPSAANLIPRKDSRLGRPRAILGLAKIQRWFPMTRHVSDADFRENPSKYLDEVTDTGAPLHIRRKAGSVVMITEDEFEGWKETIYLLQSPPNAKRLLQAIDDANAGKLQEHELIENR
jgi:antitoxin YefM